jgi:hypothetical protein
VSRCGYIIPPNLYPKTHVLKKKLILQPRTIKCNIVVKVMRERGKNELNKSRETFSLEGERSPKGGRTFALKCWCGHGLGVNVRLCAPGEGVNDRPRRCDRSLPQ